jgi:hypothetical protein
MSEVYHIGPRKVMRNKDCAFVYLGRDFRFLIGKKVMLVVQVLRTEEKKDDEAKPLYKQGYSLSDSL